MEAVRFQDMMAARCRLAPPWQSLIIGEAPSRSSDPLTAIWSGRTGRFFAELVGLEPWQAAYLFRAVNLLPLVPSTPAPKRRWMRTAGVHLYPHLAGRRAIVLGRRVAVGLGVDGELLAWRDVPGDVCVLQVPHMSGMVRKFWQGPGRAVVAGLLRAEAARAAGGALLEYPPGTRPVWLEAVVSSYG